MKYDIEANWRLLNTCNFRCDYCFSHPDALGAMLNIYATPEQWAESFNTTSKTWLLHITGGEPTIYPGFVELCEQLTKNHFVSLNSNLSHHCVNEFAEKIDPSRVHYINAAVHYFERQKKASLSVFINRVQSLQSHQFNVLVSLVMTPTIVKIYSEISQYFESFGISVIPKTMRDNYQGMRYPEAYSEKEKTLIVQYLREARLKYMPIITRMAEPATIDMFNDERFLNSNRNYHGRLCGSGYNFIKLKPDGSVFRCGSKECLGNILQKNVSFLSSPMLCNSSYCPYFCEKYTSPKFLNPQIT
ncbi:radical SAM protein [Microcoleus sp. herbarium14]|uniref:radical SAM protein n=1 Tax=Microcoleus sp. herbarium14 TaxID=3055439 RepID=UPI002FD2D9E7